jgi:hypothetical protein
MRWAGHVARTGVRKLHTSGKPEGNTTFGSFSCRWQDDIKMNLKEIGRRCVDGIDVAQDRDRNSGPSGSTICGSCLD